MTSLRHVQQTGVIGLELLSQSSDVVLTARPWPRGASRPHFYGFGLFLSLGTYGLAGSGLESCVNKIINS